MKDFAKSDSSVQREIENTLFCRIQSELNVKLEQNPIITLNSDVRIQPDFFSAEAQIIGEIHSHSGRLKPAQLHKIEADILKMILLEKVLKKNFTKYIVICSDEEYKQLNGKSFVAEAIRQFEVNVRFYELCKADNTKLKAAMYAQNLINDL